MIWLVVAMWILSGLLVILDFRDRSISRGTILGLMGSAMMTMIMMLGGLPWSTAR